jgi:stage II sporulation protein D
MAARARRKGPPPPPPGWLLDAARLEPLSPEGFLSVDGLGDYRGALELRRTADSKVAVVNDVGLEDYVKGIAEVPSTWPAEALRSQAIAARTYAAWQIKAGPSAEMAAAGAQICATEGCQVYAGLAKERQAAWMAAVEATRGQVLLHRGAPIMAKYSASNGGRSVGGGRPYLRPVDDPDDAARSPLYRWQLALSYADVSRALATPAPVTALRQEGGQVVAAWNGPDGLPGVTALPLSDFRAKVNAAVAPPAGRARPVPSLQLVLRPDDGASVATVEGRGYGHGIGMSQFGALGKALRGMKAPAILAAYYGGLRPTLVDKLPARVRVALDPGRPAVVVRGQGPFRVFDRRGRVVAASGTGAWQIVPGVRGGVRVVPPPGQGPKPAAPRATKPARRFVYRALLAVADPARLSATASSI